MLNTVILLILGRLYRQSNTVRHCLLWVEPGKTLPVPLKNDARATLWKLSISNNWFKSGNSEVQVYLPLHDLPLPSKPSLHEQLYEPMLFEQVAFMWQSWRDVVHSSISMIQGRIKNNIYIIDCVSIFNIDIDRYSINLR